MVTGCKNCMIHKLMTHMRKMKKTETLILIAHVQLLPGARSASQRALIPTITQRIRRLSHRIGLIFTFSTHCQPNHHQTELDLFDLQPRSIPTTFQYEMFSWYFAFCAVISRGRSLRAEVHPEWVDLLKI
mmetsp:Transcript_4295/g.16178  ORF Transcript_4295/g.16178 Transcript_4295/m.16178 type:complete len:130 (+) Transcript_4295:312-701(+)